MLLALSGAQPRVLSGIGAGGPAGVVSAVGRAEVRFRPFDEADARAYVATGEPMTRPAPTASRGWARRWWRRSAATTIPWSAFPSAASRRCWAEAGWRYAFGAPRSRGQRSRLHDPRTMSSAAILAIDQGTTGSTCLVVAADGRILGRAYSEFTQHFPRPGLGGARRRRDLGR